MHDKPRVSRTNRRLRTAAASTALILVASLAAGVPSGAAGGEVTIDTYPQAFPPGDATKLLATDGGVWFQTYDGAGDGTANLGRVAPDGSVHITGTAGSGYANQAPVEATDGSVWIAVGRGAATTARVPAGVAVAGIPLSSFDLAVTASTNNPENGFQTAADRSGWFWAQTDLDSTLAVIGQAMGGPLVSIQTGAAAAGDQNDSTIYNPLVLGPDGRMWLVGADGTDPAIRVVSFDPSGLVVNVAPADNDLNGLTLTEAGGDMWALTQSSSTELLSALGVDPSGTTRTIPSSLYPECHLPGLQPITDASGHLWFTGSDADCKDGGGLHVVRVATGPGTGHTIATGLDALDEVAVSDLVSQPEGVYVAGFGGDGNLAIAAVDSGGAVQTWSTGLQPFVADSQVTYPLLADPSGGVWGQAVDGSGNLVLFHAGAGGVRAVPTGLDPIARDFVIGSDGNPWSQGTDQHGRLVLVRATPEGLESYPTSLDPTQVVWAGVVGTTGDLWFRAAEAENGNLVVVRVAVGGVGPTTTTASTSSTVPSTSTTVPVKPLSPSFTG